jgi:serine phosphatase RsbU (regulator of sigma subunit)
VYPVIRGKTHIALDAMPFIIMAAVSVLAMVASGVEGVLPLLSLGPAFAALAGGPRRTLITGCVAAILCTAIAAYQSLHASSQTGLAFATVAGVTLAGVIASSGRQRRERDLADVTAIAEATQQVLLRPVPHQVGEIKLAVRYMSAASGARIGGDLYEAVSTPAGLRVIIGDVQGKGLAAVQTAATVLGVFREAAYDAPSLTVITDRIEASLARQGDSEQFVTAVLAQVSADGSRVQLLNCGHPPPLLAGRDGTRFVEPPAPGLPLGLSELAAVPRESATVELRPGESILLYTDGISEARDRHGAFFALNAPGVAGEGASADEILERLSNDVVRHVGHAIEDDAAMLLLQRDADCPSRKPGETVVPGSGTTARYVRKVAEPGAGGNGADRQRRHPAAQS